MRQIFATIKCLFLVNFVKFSTKHKNMRFAKLNISILQDDATVDFSIVLFKIIHVPCVHRKYFQNHPQPSVFCENENLVLFRG